MVDGRSKEDDEKKRAVAEWKRWPQWAQIDATPCVKQIDEVGGVVSRRSCSHRVALLVVVVGAHHICEPGWLGVRNAVYPPV